MSEATLTAHLRKPVPLGSQLVLAMTAAALAPMIALISVGYAFFYDSPGSALSFQYWTFLVVMWVLGIAFLLARLFAGGLIRQLDALVRAAVSQPGNESPVAPATTTNDFTALEHKFAQIEALVAEGCAASLERVRELEEEVEGLREAAQLQIEFLSAVSHEIRTPLSAIVSATRIIQCYHETKPEVVRRFGGTVITEGNRLVRSISDMLDLLKIEAGSMSWTDAEISPGVVVDDAAARVDSLARQRGLELTVRVSDRLPLIFGDARRIGQVLDHLLGNAVKFTPRGGKIEVVADVTESSEVSFRVADTGVGIPAEELPYIFEKARALRASTETGRERAGVGLGLSLCREIVARHGGVLRARSVQGKGATFEVLLPATLEATCSPAEAAAERRQPRAILLMKNDVLADCAVRALRLAEIDAKVCSSLQEFFQTLEQWPPEIVVMSTSFAWNMNDATEQRIRAAGVKRILLYSAREGLVELAPPGNTEPVLALLARVVPDGATVLLVEDDEEYGAVMEFELAQAGYSVVKAYNGVDGVELAAKRRPDAMILDLALPQLDGFGVLDALIARGVALPTVVLTGLEDPTLEERLAELGALATIRKYELIDSRDTSAVARVVEVLEPVLAVAASDPVEDIPGVVGA